MFIFEFIFTYNSCFIKTTTFVWHLYIMFFKWGWNCILHSISRSNEIWISIYAVGIF